jgi:hypothetical protein
MAKKFKKRRSVAMAAECSPPVTRVSGRRKYYAASLCALVLLVTSAVATRFDPVRRAVGLHPLAATPARDISTLPLAKEYVYVGGRLVATEEPLPVATPTPAPVGSPPTNFVAAFEAIPAGAGGVRLSWARPAGSITGYVIERRRGADANDPVTPIPVNGDVETYTDSPGEGEVAYLYRVRAVFNGGGSSPYSAYDLATTVAFTDDPLRPKETPIKAVHLTELRRAVRVVRILVGKGEPAWSHPDPVSSPASARRAIYLADVTDLRQQLGEALAALDQALGVQTFVKPYPPDPPLGRGAVVYAAHFEQIRARVK